MHNLNQFIEPIVILANGEFPQHDIPLHILDNAGSIICCDGAIESLIDYGKRPQAIVGDFDSIPQNLKHDLSHLLVHTPDQSENDLRKTIKWVEIHGGLSVTILGASGKREDHLLGNIFSLLSFKTNMDIQMVTDHGRFFCIHDEQVLEGFPRQQVSIFTLDNTIKITTQGLKYSLHNESLPTLYSGTLNEIVKSPYTLKISHGKLLVFCAF